MVADVIVNILPVSIRKDTYYLWTCKDQVASYREGLKGWDWGGPFTSTDAAKVDARLAHKVLTDNIEFQALCPIKVPGYIVIERPQIRFAIPLDEFSERLLDNKKASFEHKAFLSELKIDLDLTALAIAQNPDMWVVNFMPRKKFTATAQDGQVWIQIPATIQYGNRKGLLRDEFFKLLQPQVSLGTLYELVSPVTLS